MQFSLYKPYPYSLKYASHFKFGLDHEIQINICMFSNIKAFNRKYAFVFEVKSNALLGQLYFSMTCIPAHA